MTAGEAIIQSENNFWLDYPFTGVLSDTLLKRDPNYGAQPSRYVFYTDLRSRVHAGVGDWDDDDWDRAYLKNDTIRNPVSDGTVFSNPPDMIVSSRNYMDSVYSYSVETLGYVSRHLVGKPGFSGTISGGPFPSW
jgi:hypothetical protein